MVDLLLELPEDLRIQRYYSNPRSISTIVALSESDLPFRKMGAVDIRRYNNRPGCSRFVECGRTRTEKPSSPSGTRRGKRSYNERDMVECERLARIYTLVDESENRSDGLTPIKRENELVIGQKGSRQLRRAARAQALLEMNKKRVRFAESVSPGTEKIMQQLSAPCLTRVPVNVAHASPVAKKLSRLDEEKLALEIELLTGSEVTKRLPLVKGFCKFCGISGLSYKYHDCTGPPRPVAERLTGLRFDPYEKRSRRPTGVPVSKPRRVEHDKTAQRLRTQFRPGLVCTYCGYKRVVERAPENTAPCPAGGHPKSGKHVYVDPVSKPD